VVGGRAPGHAGRADLVHDSDIKRGEYVIDAGAGIKHTYRMAALEVIALKRPLRRQPPTDYQNSVESVCIVVLAQHQRRLQRVGGCGIEIAHDDPRRRRARCDIGQRLSLGDPRSRVRDFQMGNEYGYNRPVHVHLRF